MTRNTQSNYWQFKTIGWGPFLKFLVAANIITIVAPWVIYGAALLQNQVAPTQESGWGLLFLTPLWYAGAVIAVVNIVAAVMYVIARKPRRNAALLSLLVGVLSAAYLVILLSQFAA